MGSRPAQSFGTSRCWLTSRHFLPEGREGQLPTRYSELGLNGLVVSQSEKLPSTTTALPLEVVPRCQASTLFPSLKSTWINSVSFTESASDVVRKRTRFDTYSKILFRHGSTRRSNFKG